MWTIKCCYCKREVNLAGLVGRGLAWLIKNIPAALVNFILEAMAKRALGLTRGLVDGGMAEAANGFGMACPQCKSVDCWDPVSDEEQKIENQKNENLTV